MKRQNRNLRKIYNNIFLRGEDNHFSKMKERSNRSALPSDESVVLSVMEWKGKKVLDVGCGTGLFAYEAANRGANVLGVDYSFSGIELANKNHTHPNLKFECMDIKNITGQFDVIVSLGTLEHMDDPFRTISFLKKHLKPNGSMIFTCPNWINTRGYVLMTLHHLFDAPITLADIHYLSPVDFGNWARKLGMKLEWQTFDQNRAHGVDLIKDFKKRLPNVLRDSKLPSKPKNIENFLNWLEKQIKSFPQETEYSGASGLYHLKSK